MGSDDSSPDSVNLETYLHTWERLGFDATSFRDDVTRAKPSEFVELQATVESAHELTSRMKPFQSSDIIQQLTDHFRNPQDLKDVEDQFNRWCTVNAPWESGYYRWYPRWSITEELQDQFWNIINIAALLDESSWTSLDLLLPLIAQPENYPNILNELEQLVQDEERQRTLIEKAVLQLKEKGYDVVVQSSKIIEQFDEIEEFKYSWAKEMILFDLIWDDKDFENLDADLPECDPKIKISASELPPSLLAPCKPLATSPAANKPFILVEWSEGFTLIPPIE